MMIKLRILIRRQRFERLLLMQDPISIVHIRIDLKEKPFFFIKDSFSSVTYKLNNKYKEKRQYKLIEVVNNTEVIFLKNRYG